MKLSFSSKVISGFKLLTLSRLGFIGLLIILAFVFMALAAPILTPYDPSEAWVAPRFQPPSWEHPLGTDDAGRDVFAQIVYGARVSLLVGITAAALSTLLGALIGLTSGYFGSIVDVLLMRLTDVFLILPMIPLAILLAMYFGPSLFNIVILLGFLGWPGAARQIRAQVLSLKEASYVEAARALGASNKRIMFVHLLPNVTGVIIANLIGGSVGAILSEAGLAFLGVIDPRTISWGRIISRSLNGHAIIFGAWWTLIMPGLCITLLACGFSFFSHGLTLILNPQLRRTS